jgi:hypothetical protein
MGTDEARPEHGVPPEAPPDPAAWAAQVEAAWAEGSAGWHRLAAERGVPAEAPATALAEAAPTRCWWDGPPWCGRIPDAEFRAIVAAYVACHGSYTPDLPEREPGVLREWLRAHGYATPAAPQAAA